MSAVTIPWLAACAVLGVAGVAKVRTPDPTVGALRRAGLPGSRTLVYAFGAAEVLLAGLAAATGAAPLAALVALLYVAFAGFVAVTLRRGGMVQTCGCFGSPDVPATAVHVAANALSAAAAVAAAAGSPGTVADLAREGAAGAAALALVALATFQVLVVLTVLPRARFRAAVATGGPTW